MASLPIKRLTPEAYFAVEETTEYRNEYFHGEIFAMAGGTPAHGRIAINLVGELAPAMSESSCEIFGSDTRIKVSEAVYTYPDLAATRGGSEFTTSHLSSLMNPILIIEVLSPSTESYDQGEKFANYRQIPTLKQYVLVAQDTMRAESYVRQNGDQWLLSVVEGPDATLNLPTIGQSVLLSDVYARVTFETETTAIA